MLSEYDRHVRPCAFTCEKMLGTLNDDDESPVTPHVPPDVIAM
jgi:hypothetical protein